MDYLPWSDDYRVGVAVIDDDHRMLFRLVNRLHARLQAGAGEDAVGEVLEGLADYVETHFAREERYMEECGYPDVVAHATKHRDLARTVRSLRTLYEDDPAGFPEGEILAFLKDWLTGHILKSDMDYVPYITGDKKGRLMTGR